jgi:hypothetical protein
MRLLGVVILGGVGAIFLGLFVLAWMAGSWLGMGVTGGTMAALAGAIILWLRPDDPGAPVRSHAGPTWDPLLDAPPRALHRTDGADPGGGGDATPTSDSGDSPGDGGGSSD